MKIMEGNYWKLIGHVVVLLSIVNCVRSCYPGLVSGGVTTPTGDILLQIGRNLTINCTLKENINKTSQSHDFEWRRDGEEVPSRYITVLDNYTAQLNVDNVTIDQSGNYNCGVRNKINKEYSSICTNNVQIMEKLKKVDVFHCLSIEFQNMTCTWPVDAGSDTTWTLQFANGRGFTKCPSYVSDSSGNTNGCFFSAFTDPPYPSRSTLVFKLIGKNKISQTESNFKIDHYKRVVAPAPENLKMYNLGINTMKVEWGKNFRFDNDFAEPVVFRILYRSQWDPEEHWNNIDTNDTNIVLTNLIPWTEYAVMVRSKVGIAPDDEEMWSKSVNAVHKTLSIAPNETVAMSPSAFYDVDFGMELRNVTIFWKPLNEKQYNGPNFHYVVKIYSGEKELGFTKILDSKNFSATFPYLRKNETYRLVVHSVNDLGTAPLPAEINIPDSFKKLPEPDRFTAIYYKDDVYELSWAKNNDSAVKQYVIFWCRLMHMAADNCQEYPEWTIIDSESGAYNVTVSDRSINYRFAISAFAPNASSGMVWSRCVANYDTGVVQKVKILGVRVENATQAHVSWLLDCLEKLGIIQGFQVMYCVWGTNNVCLGEQMNETVLGAHSDGYTLTNLLPYTNYSVRVAAMTKSGKMGESGDPHFAMTYESRPDAPEDVRVINTSSSSIQIEWKEPTVTNGKIVEYSIRYKYRRPNFVKYVINKTQSNSTYSEVLRHDIKSYTNYSIEIQACNRAGCSDSSEPLYVLTAIGEPGKPNPPNALSLNATHYNITWSKPRDSNGPINEWEMTMQWYLSGSNSSDPSQVHHKIYPTHETYLVVPIDCESQTKYLISVRAINYEMDNESGLINKRRGPDSDQREFDACFNGWELTTTGIGIIVGCIAGSLAVAICVYCYIKFQSQIKEFKDSGGIILPTDLMQGYINRNTAPSNNRNTKPSSLEKGTTDLYSNRYRPDYDRLQSVSSSDSGRSSQTSQSSNDTTIEMLISVSSNGEEHANTQEEVKSRSSTEGSSCERDSVFSESGLMAAADTVLTYSAVDEQWSIDKKPTNQTDEPTCYSKVSVLPSKEVVIHANDAALTRPLGPAYSRFGVAMPLMSYVRVNDVEDPPAQTITSASPKIPKNDVQKGYSRVAAQFLTTNLPPATNNRPPTGYVTAESLSPTDNSELVPEVTIPVNGSLYLGAKAFESTDDGNQGRGYISCDNGNLPLTLIR